jgi:predicted  nucleic acid-binding Zn-ribbon protein
MNMTREEAIENIRRAYGAVEGEFCGTRESVRELHKELEDVISAIAPDSQAAEKSVVSDTRETRVIVLENRRLHARVVELEHDLEHVETDLTGCIARAERAEVHIAKLVEALTKIAGERHDFHFCGCHLHARAALASE